jgi:DNA end-binding protein Ku
MALWKGTVSFGLVAVPVQILPAIRSHRTAFRMLHAEDNSPVQRKMLCPEENVFVHPEHQQRGYPLPDGGHVIVLDSELKELEPKRSEDIEIESFVDLGQVDPVFFDRPYYVLPAGPEKPYRLLVEALADSNKAGIAKLLTPANRQATVRPAGPRRRLPRIGSPEKYCSGTLIASSMRLPRLQSSMVSLPARTSS